MPQHQQELAPRAQYIKAPGNGHRGIQPLSFQTVTLLYACTQFSRLLYAPAGFATGEFADKAYDMLCTKMRRSVQLIVDIGTRTMCIAYWKMTGLILTPNNPSIVNVHQPDNTQMLSRPTTSLSQRHTLLYFSGTCIADIENIGKLFRCSPLYICHARWIRMLDAMNLKALGIATDG